MARSPRGAYAEARELSVGAAAAIADAKRDAGATVGRADERETGQRLLRLGCRDRHALGVPGLVLRQPMVDPHDSARDRLGAEAEDPGEFAVERGDELVVGEALEAGVVDAAR